MQLNIPEIGNEIILEKDWKLKLVLENRNDGLIKHFFPGHFSHRNYGYHIELDRENDIWINALMDISTHAEFVVKHKELEKIHGNDRFSIEEKMVDYIRNESDIMTEEKIPLITIPKGTKLKVDRIYIRKGKGMSDFSSVTFWALLPGEKKKIRFFAKLTDVNNIKYIS